MIFSIRTLFIGLCLFCIHLSAGAQSNFQPGKVVLNNGDTLTGEINDRQWKVNPGKIFFQSANIQKELTIDECKYFEITGGSKYERFTVTADMRQIEAEKVPADIQDSTITIKVFLKQLVKGDTYSLYHFKDFKDHFYMQLGSAVPEELIYKAFFKKPSDLSVWKYAPGNVHYLHTFRDQITRFFLNDPRIQKEINKSEYKQNDLTKLFMHINAREYVAPRSRAVFKPYAGAGVVFTKMKFSGKEGNFENTEFNANTSPVIHAGLIVTGRREVSKFSFMFDLAWWKAKFEGNSTKTDNNNVEFHYTYQIEQSNLIASVHTQYDFYRSPVINVFGSVGIGYDFLKYPVLYQSEKTIITGNVHEKTYDFENGVVLGLVSAGVTVKKHFGLTVYTKFFNSSYSGYSNISADQSINGLSVRYIFK